MFTGDAVAAIELIRQGTLRAFLPGYRKMLNNGQELKFKGLVLTKSHLHEGELSVPLRGVSSFRTQGPNLVLRMRDGAEQSFHVHGKANVHVMIGLVDEIVHAGPTPVAPS